MPAPEITFEMLEGAALDGPGLDGPGLADELHGLRAEVYADPPYQLADDPERFARRLRVQRRQPGFALAVARSGGYLVGYAAGMPLRPSTSWWRELTTPLPEDVTEERPGRTFALTDLLVRAAWRRQGIGSTLHDALLGGRGEERATLTVWPAAGPAQHAFRAWGWHKVARTREAEPGAAVADVLLRTLPGGRPG